jgi:prepilin-type N-terminal cleavage/methylation domain-containing protein
MRKADRSERGFTLVEILVVVAILGVLMGLVALLVPKARRTQDQFITEQRIQQLVGAIERYRQERIGKSLEFPPMTLQKLGSISKYFEGLGYASPNDVNECCEVLLLALRHPDLSAKLDPSQLSGEDPVANTDADVFNRPPPGRGDADATEIVDSWGNPIVYIEKNSYGKVVRIALRDGQQVEVQAKRRPDGNYYNEDTYQVISLGPNEAWDEPGSPGYDDITNFKVAEK